MKNFLAVCFGVLVSATVFGQGGGFGGASPDGNNVFQRDGMKVFRDGGILTASEDAPYPVAMKPGDGLWISVSSAEFDTSVKVVDKDGTVLAENDDAAPGTQNSQMIYSFDREGEFKVVVGGFKSKSGGKYQIELRLFHSFSVAPGVETVVPFFQNEAVFLRVPGKRGEYHSIRWTQAGGVSGTFMTGSGIEPPRLPIYDALPNGLTQSTHIGWGLLVGREEDVYVRMSPRGANMTKVRVDLAESLTFKEGNMESKVGPGGVAIVSLSGRAGQIVQLDSASGSFLNLTENAGQFMVSGSADDKAVVDFDPNRSKDGDKIGMLLSDPGKKAPAATVFFRKDGDMKLLVMTPKVEGDRLVARVVGTPFGIGGSAQGRLKIGETLYYLFDGKAGDWLDFSTVSSDFDPETFLINPNGEVTVFNDDSRSSLNSGLNAFLLADGRYFVVVRCPGGGGGGVFTLSSSKRPIPVMRVGDEISVSFDDLPTKIWSLDLKAGQTLVFEQISGDLDSMDVLADAGSIEVGQSILGGRRFLLVKVLRDSPARLWLRGRGEAKVRLKSM